MTATLTAVAPRFRFVPLHVSSAAQDAIDLGVAAGLTLDDSQQDDLRVQMAKGANGKWAATEVADVEPRQNGKGAKLEVRQLWGLFLNPRDKLQTHTAHRFDTCLDHFRRIRSLIEGTPDLLELVKDNGRGLGDTPSGIKDSNGKESIELRDGSRLNFKARSKGSGRGFSGDAVYFDEAFWLDDLGSLIPSLSARFDPQIWYMSSAPLPRSESDRLRKVIRRGRALALAGDPTGKARLCYTEYSADPKFLTDLDNPEALYTANPGTAVGRITPEFAAVEREAMSDEEYARERLGIFPDEDDEPQWLVIPEAAWSSTVVPAEVGWLVAPRLAVEVAPDFSEASIVAAGACADGEGVELVDHRQGVAWLVARVAELAGRHGGAVAIDKGSTADLKFTGELLAAGVDVLLAETADVVLAEADLILGVGAGRVFHPRADDQQPLDLSVASVALRPYGDVSLVDRRIGAVVGPFIAAGLALWASRQEPEQVADPEFLVI